MIERERARMVRARRVRRKIATRSTVTLFGACFLQSVGSQGEEKEEFSVGVQCLS